MSCFGLSRCRILLALSFAHCFPVQGVEVQDTKQETLVFSVHQPEDSPTYRWLSLVYQDLFSRLGLDIKLRYIPAARSTSSDFGYFLDGQAGRVAGYENISNFVQVPESLYSLNMRAYVQSDSGLYFDSWESLAGKSLRIEYMRGASLPKGQLVSLIEEKNLTTVTTIEQGFRKLKADRTDVFLASDLSAWPYTTSPEFIYEIIQAGIVDSTDFSPYLNNNYKELIPNLTQAIKDMKQEGLIQKYLVQEFGEDVLTAFD